MKRVMVVLALVVASLLPSTAADAQSSTGTAPTTDQSARAFRDVRLVSTPPQVGTLTHCGTVIPSCGHIYNDDSNTTLRITDNWAAYLNSGTWRYLAPGQNSMGIGVTDADGLYVPSGCTATIAFIQVLGPGWYKVYDGQHIHVTNLC